MLIRWIIGFQHSVPNGSASWRSWSLGCLLKGEPHLDLIGYSQVGHTNFCYKYCALMIDIAHGKRLIKQSKWTSNCGARRQEGRRRGGRDDVWSWVSELTGAGQGEGEKTCPPGNHKALSFSPCYNQHHHSKQHGLILTGLAGVPSAFMWLLVLHRATLKPASESFYDCLNCALG